MKKITLDANYWDSVSCYVDIRFNRFSQLIGEE